MVFCFLYKNICKAKSFEVQYRQIVLQKTQADMYILLVILNLMIIMNCLNRKIFIACFLLVVSVLLYGAIGSCFYTYLGYGQIATDFSDESRIENCIDFFDGNEHKKVYCDKITYDLICSIQEYNSNACYFMEIGYCSLWPEYGKLRAIKLV